MVPNRPSRRSLLLAGGATVGTGIVGRIAWQLSSDDGTRSPGGLTAGTVPAGSDPLVWVDIDRAETAAEKAATATLLRSSVFNPLPKTLRSEIDDELSGSKTTHLEEIVLIGVHAREHGAAIVWANWSDERIRGLVGSADSASRETYNGYSLHTDGETSVVVLNDGVFAVGATPAVRNVVDVWNDDVRPVSGDTLRRFEGTPRGNVRFSFDTLRLPCEGVTENRPEPYGRVTQVAGATLQADSALRVELFVDSHDSVDDVASAVRTDLGKSSAENRTENASGGFPEFITDNITVSHQSDFVRIEYGDVDGESGEYVRKIIRTVSCRVDSAAERQG